MLKVIIFRFCSKKNRKKEKEQLRKERENKRIQMFGVVPVTVCSSGGSSRLGISVGSVTTLKTHRKAQIP